MKPHKIHGPCFTAPGTFTACGLFARNAKVTADNGKITCFRCRQILRLIAAADKPAEERPPQGMIRAPRRKKYKPSAAVVAGHE